jgi:hypothetical protein
MHGPSPWRRANVSSPPGQAASRIRFDDVRDATYRAERLDGCDVFANAKYCDPIADRVAELAVAFGG